MRKASNSATAKPVHCATRVPTATPGTFMPKPMTSNADMAMLATSIATDIHMARFDDCMPTNQPDMAVVASVAGAPQTRMRKYSSASLHAPGSGSVMLR